MLSKAPRPPRPLMLSVSPQDSEQWPLQIPFILPGYPALVPVFLSVPSVSAQGSNHPCLILIVGPSVAQAEPVNAPDEVLRCCAGAVHESFG